MGKICRAIRHSESLPADAQIELQDLWLADPRIPSATGAITDQVIDEPPQLAESMRLIRAKNFTRTDRGRALLALLSDDERRALATGQVSDGAHTNLFLLSLGRALLPCLRPPRRRLRVRAGSIRRHPRGQEFTRAQFADHLNEACRTLRQRWVRRARSGAERRLLTRLDEWAKLIDRPRLSGKKWGGGRPPDQLATVRLEPYVDFGMVTRLSRSAYRYELSAAQQAFFDELDSRRQPR